MQKAHLILNGLISSMSIRLISYTVYYTNRLIQRDEDILNEEISVYKF